MRWEKRGIVWKPDGSHPWARSHAMCPTPVLLDDKTLRVFVTTLDDEGRGHATYVDLSADDPTIVNTECRQPVLRPGVAGAFDDNGVTPLSVIQRGDALYMYYAGFELCHHIRYRIFTGLAISRDDGQTFERHSKVPVLDRSDAELYFRCGPFAMTDGEEVRMWYIGGDAWTAVGRKLLPVYDLRYASSKDGKVWPDKGQVCLEIQDSDEHGFGRPWIIQRSANYYQMFYSIRRRSLGAYRLGYAESMNGLQWTRKDAEMGLDVTPGSFDSDAIMYAAVIAANGKTYCFYNGNNFGEAGFALAELTE